MLTENDKIYIFCSKIFLMKIFSEHFIQKLIESEFDAMRFEF